MKEQFEQLMQQGLEDFSIHLSDKQIKQFYEYYELLIKWNEKINLTAITKMEEVVKKHFIDSLSLVNAVPKEQFRKMTLLDLGTGAGFPGIPVKIAFPEIKITLLDSLKKRTIFLKEVINTLELRDIDTVHGRAEDWGKETAYREQFDLCVSRAVANLSVLSEYCIPFVKLGGYFIPYKSGNVQEEIDQAGEALKLLGGKMEAVVQFKLPDSDIERTLIKIKKIKKTVKTYPRKAGIPGKAPLVLKGE